MRCFFLLYQLYQAGLKILLKVSHTVCLLAPSGAVWFMKSLSIKSKPANLLYQQLGDCYLYTNQMEKAEEAYRRAVDMVPNRFGTRYSLFNFYLKNHQYKKAKITGNSLLRLPIKIPSAQVNYILRSVKKNILTE